MIVIIAEKHAPEQKRYGRRASFKVPHWMGRLLLKLGTRWR